MGQMQWLGILPEGDRYSALAEALEKGTTGYSTGLALAKKNKRESATEARALRTEQRMEKASERAGRAEERTIESEKAKIATVAYDKKAQTANFIRTATSSMSKEDADKLLKDPSVEALFKDLGWPLPYGVGRVPERPFKITPGDIKAAGNPMWPGKTQLEKQLIQQQRQQFSGGGGAGIGEFSDTAADLTRRRHVQR